MRLRLGSILVLVGLALGVALPAYLGAQGNGNGNQGNGNGNASLVQQVAALQATVVQLQAALNAESAARRAADTTLKNNINAEAAARKQGDADTLAAAKNYTDTQISAEAAARQAADTTLQNNINQEAVARITGDNKVGTPVPQVLLDLANYVSVDPNTINGLAGPHIIFSGANVHVRSGVGLTYSTNGLGNLVVGYNEDTDVLFHFSPAVTAADRFGSHNLIVGGAHRDPAFGAFVAGYMNIATHPASSVSGGAGNTASADFSSVSGGIANTASGESSSVSGGSGNTSSGLASSVSGGSNTAGGELTSVSGGGSNAALGLLSSVSGGNGRTAAGVNNWVAGGLTQPN